MGAEGCRLDAERPLETEVARWAVLLEHHGLVELALPYLDVLRVWGFVGAQILWMLSFFSSSETLSDLATVLEQPDFLEALQHYLTEGGAPG